MHNNYLKYKASNKIFMEGNGDIETGYPQLPPGIYEMGSMGGFFTKEILTFTPIEIKESLINFKSGVFEGVVSSVEKFLDKSTIEKYKYLGITHKMGILMYGPPGTGKTCLSYICMMEAASRFNALCFDCTGHAPNFFLRVLKEIRKIQDNLIIVFVDEADAAIKNHEYAYLPYLDGGDSIPGSIFLGCTNHLKNIPTRIVNRKSRIRHAFEVKSLPDEVYKEFIKTKLPDIEQENLAQFSYLSAEAGLSMDELKTAIIEHYIDGNTYTDAIKKAKEYAKQGG